MCAFEEAIKNVEVKVYVQRGALGFRGKFDIDVLVPPDSHFYPLLSCGVVLDDYLVHSCWGLQLGSRLLQSRGSWSTHGLP